MIDIRKLKELVRLMVDSELTELDLRDSEEQVTLRRQSLHHPPHVSVLPAAHAAIGAAMAHPVIASAPTGVADPSASVSADIGSEAGLQKIESPMVGTFYAAGDPDAPPFVSVGSAIGPNTVVCLIEAMKIFNEIKAECSGTIQKVLVKNGEAVEFGQTLFLVKPD
jgi:acetyl-CoA carboxylase biotin carboxyl carrier protein